MNKTLTYGLVIAGLVGVVAQAQAVGTRARFMAANCSYCHGPDGKSRGNIPQLAGMDPKYFVEQMQAFKAGTRPGATVMGKHANGYTDAEFHAMAKYFAAVK